MNVNNPYRPISSYISSERVSYLFLIFTVLFSVIFNLSFIDLLFWHADMGCKNLIYGNMSLSLNIWLEISSIYGLCYTVLFFSLFMIAIECKEQTSVVIGYEKITKVFFIISTVFSFSWNIVGVYIMGVFYKNICNISLFNNYMWVRLALGCSINIIFTFIVFLKMKYSDTPSIRNWFYIVQTTYTPPSN